MQLYQTFERVYWSIFEPLPMHMGADLENIPLQFPMDLVNKIDPARYGSKAVRGLAERVCRSLEFALGNGAEPGLLAYPLFVVRNFYEGLGMGMGVTTSWDGLGAMGAMGVNNMGMGVGMGTNIGMDMGMGVNMNTINYSAGMNNLNMMDTMTATTMMMQQPQTQAPPPDGSLQVIWCDHFREKLRAKGVEISNSIMGQGRKWREIAAFGY